MNWSQQAQILTWKKDIFLFGWLNKWYELWLAWMLHYIHHANASCHSLFCRLQQVGGIQNLHMKTNLSHFFFKKHTIKIFKCIEIVLVSCCICSCRFYLYFCGLFSIYCSLAVLLTDPPNIMHSDEKSEIDIFLWFQIAKTATLQAVIKIKKSNYELCAMKSLELFSVCFL